MWNKAFVFSELNMLYKLWQRNFDHFHIALIFFECQSVSMSFSYWFFIVILNMRNFDVFPFTCPSWLSWHLWCNFWSTLCSAHEINHSFYSCRLCRLGGFMVPSQKIFSQDSRCMPVVGVQFTACLRGLHSRDQLQSIFLIVWARCFDGL